MRPNWKVLQVTGKASLEQDLNSNNYRVHIMLSNNESVSHEFFNKKQALVYFNKYENKLVRFCEECNTWEEK